MLLAETWIPDLSGIFAHFAAEAVLVIAMPVLIVADLMARREKKESVAGVIGLLAMIVAFFLAILQDSGDTAMLTKLLRADGLAKAFRVLAIGTGMVAAVSALRNRDVTRHRTEFYVCLLGAVLGACFTAAANDLAMLYLAIETLSIAGYLLAGFKKESAQGAEAAMKYVIFGAVSSGAMLYGMTLIYGFAGTAVITTPVGETFNSIQSVAATKASEPAFLIAIVMVFAGLAYKIAAAPFQFWCPDVYQGSPTSVAAFLAVASKGAGFAAALRFVVAVTDGGATLPQLLAENNDLVRGVLLVMALITMSIANVAALRQQNSKRLLAYSAIAHAGYLLLGVAVTSEQGAAAVVFYMIVYLFMTLAVFYMVGVVERETNGRTDIDAFEGLGFKAPVFAACMLICLIGLTGLPPTGGFIGKFFIFQGVFAYAGDTASAGMSSLFFWGGIIGLLNGVVSLYYYMRFVKVMYLCDMDRAKERVFSFAGLDKGLILAMTAPVLVFGIFFKRLAEFATDLTGGLF